MGALVAVLSSSFPLLLVSEFPPPAVVEASSVKSRRKAVRSYLAVAPASIAVTVAVAGTVAAVAVAVLTMHGWGNKGLVLGCLIAEKNLTDI
jgi:anti-sigma factor RsiW